jgi:hypothetical protein
VNESREHAERRVFLTLKHQPKTGEGVNELVSMIRSIMFPRFMELLWRGSRDGFKARTFHERCDGRENTLTLIRGTKGNIFRGFTRIERESSFLRKQKVDRLRKGFIFTLKNPHGLSERKFSH